MFYIKYLTMYKVHVHAGVMRKLLYGLCVCTGDSPLAKLVDYLPVHTHKPYNNLHLTFLFLLLQIWQLSKIDMFMIVNIFYDGVAIIIIISHL